MSKRVADTQLTKDSDDSSGSYGGGQPQRATAAQMATRRLAKPRGGRRPGTARPSLGLGSTSSALRQQQSLPAFGQPTASQQAGSASGQQQNGNTQNQTSASFPQFGGSSNSLNGGFNNPFTAPSGAFSFNTAPVNNPFSSTNTGSQPASQTNGFQGSIFNVPTPATNTQFQTAGQTKLLFTPGAPNFNSQVNGLNQASTNGFTWPPPQSNSQSDTSNIFSQPSATQVQQPPMLDQNNTKPNEPTTGIFASLKPTEVQDPGDQSKQLSSDTFAHPKAPETNAVNNPFAASIAKFQDDQTNKPTTNLFGSFNQQPTQSSSNVAGTTPAFSPQSQPEPFSSSIGDSMQTSPDNTPQREPQTQSTPVSFSNQSASQPQMSPTKSPDAQPVGASLFDRVTKPPIGTPSPASPGPTKTVFNQPSGVGLFNSVSKPQDDLRDITTNSDLPSTSPGMNQPMEIQQNPAPGSKTLDNPSFQTPSQLSMSQENQSSPDDMLSGPRPLSSWRNWRDLTDAEIDANYKASLDSLLKRKTYPNADDHGPGYPPSAPDNFTEEEQRQLVTGYRLKQLDIGMEIYRRSHPGRDMDFLRQFWQRKKQAILAAGDDPVESVIGDKRQAPNESQSETSEAKKQKQNAFTATGGPTPSDKPSQEAGQAVIPNKSNGPLQPATSNTTKRKADENLARDVSTVASDNTKRPRGPDTTPKSQTSSLFSNILNAGDNVTSPEKPQAAANGTTPSSDLFQPQAPPTNISFGAIPSSSPPVSQPSQSRPMTTLTSTAIASSSTFKPTTAASQLSSTQNAPSIKPLFGTSPSVVTSAPNLFTVKPTPVTTSAASTPATSATPSFKPMFGGTPSALSSTANPFTIKPTLTDATNASTLGASELPSFKPPSFGTGAPGNFMAQFGDAAKKSEEEAKKKRKAEDYDSEEEDESTWEQRDAEEQKKKRQKIAEAAKAAQIFVPQFGSKQDNVSTEVAPKPKSPVKSIFDQTHPAFGNSEAHHNIFGHLAKQIPNAVASKNSEADDEADSEYEPEDAPKVVVKSNPFGSASNPAQPLGRSVFDRVSKPAEDLTSKIDAPVSEASPTSDHTWNINSPIKFGASTTSPPGPVVNVTSASPSKTPFSGLFGAPKFTAATETPTKPGASIFSNLQSTNSPASVGFGFAPVNSVSNALAPPSNNTSRATSPGATTGESANESAAEGVADSTEKHSQLDLMSEHVGEEDEDVLLEVKAKGLRYNAETKSWMSKGVGPLRVLKHRETGKPRIVLRAEPSGRVVINSGFIKEGNYENIGCKTVAAPIIADGKLGPWRLRVGNDKDLKKLWETLDENKKFA